MVRSAFLATLVVGALAAVPASAQAPPTLPDHYALTNVRIVTAPGRVIERGTVVLRDGRIVAAAANAQVPAGAIHMDLPGHTVYAGLVDVATSFGLPSVVQRGGPGASATAGTEVMPAREASSVFEPSDAELAAVRNSGVTTLGLVFDGGIFPGRVSAVHTGNGEQRVLRTPVAQQVMLGRRRGGYPGTLMGSIAYVTQQMWDAQHSARVRQAWERQPTGPRPTYSEDHRALEPAATGGMPVWLMAGTERDLGRVIDLAADVGVRNYVIVGAQEGWRAASRLRAAGQPVIVSVDFPNPSQITGRSFELNVAPVSGPNDVQAQADSAAAREARGNAAALARAGIPFALASWGMPSPSSLRERARAAVEAGLSADDALRALTVTPARLLGLEGAIGTVESGRLANIIVTDGDLFAENTRVKYVFVDGVRYEVPATPAPRARGNGAGAAGAAGVAAFAGNWVTEVDGPSGLMQVGIRIRVEGDQVSGTLVSELGDVELTGEHAGGEITLRGTAAPPGMNAMALTLTGRLQGQEMRGMLTVQGISPIAFTARREPDGSWMGGTR